MNPAIGGPLIVAVFFIALPALMLWCTPPSRTRCGPAREDRP